MTREQFQAKAKKVIDSEMFGFDEALFDYEELGQMRVAQFDNWGDPENSMPFIDFINELYEQIKRDLK